MLLKKYCTKCGNIGLRDKEHIHCINCNTILTIDENIDIDIVYTMTDKQKREYVESLSGQPVDLELNRQWNERCHKIHYENQQKLNQYANKPKCPTCQSTNISKIGTVNRMFSVGLFGLASSKIGKTHKCNKCGSTW